MNKWAKFGEYRNLFGCYFQYVYIDGLMQERCNSIANALELHLPCTNPSICVFLCTSIYVPPPIDMCVFVYKYLCPWMCVGVNEFTHLPSVQLHLIYAPIFNSLRAKFYRGNINIYLHLMSLLHIDMTQVLRILPQVRPAPTYST